MALHPIPQGHRYIALCTDVDCDGITTCVFDLSREQPLFRESNYASVMYVDLLYFDAVIKPELSEEGITDWQGDGYISSYDFHWKH